MFLTSMLHPCHIPNTPLII